MKRIALLLRGTGRLGRDTRGAALLEFALSLPILLVMSLTGAELTNYITTRMRISQLALHLADNAARMGSGGQLMAKTISEADINDLLTGAGLQAGELELYANGRVILSSLEPTANPNTNSTYKITWQRCRGSKTTHGSTYGTVGQSSGTNMTGMGPSGRQAVAPDNGATMFVEVYYEYQPLVKTSLAPTTEIVEVASMMVRDARDLTQIYNAENATRATC
ncbi:TadE/TadG family type IV pilus assembly protein [Sphingomonas canadensis]|uniref:TadE/TadG family type IV pilus assembly protein n=1 Tax=Sphingomonas canadensis TaxID=1219257 RepID=A0ABW3HCE7_9SPHN|nr:pilus assembly protein [Sphingomonas canadensis]MCW3836861.1 pilus assembly protein [Sphingomonas canadensis]